MTQILRILAILVMLLVLLATFYQASSASSLNWLGEKFPLGAYIATTGLLLLGIAFSSLYKNLTIAPEEVNILLELRRIYRSRSFWTSVCVAPFVLFGVYSVVSQSPGDPASYLLAFQNGFFCESIFRQIVPDARQLNRTASKEVPPL